MNKLTHNTLLALAGLALTSVACARDVDETVDASATGHVDVVNTAGTVEVEGWSRSAVRVTGELGDRVEELILERDGDRVLVKVKVPRRSSRQISSDIYVRIPEQSSLDVSTVSAEIMVENVDGEQQLSSVSGDIDTEIASEDLHVESVSGDIYVDGSGGSAEIRGETVSGDMMFENVGGSIGSESVSGDIDIEGGVFERVDVELVNGDLMFDAELADGGRFSAEAVNGDIDVNFTGGVSARFDIETFNGDIRNCFGPEPERTSRYAPGLELSFIHGDDDGRFIAATLNGDIAICED